MAEFGPNVEKDGRKNLSNNLEVVLKKSDSLLVEEHITWNLPFCDYQNFFLEPKKPTTVASTTQQSGTYDFINISFESKDGGGKGASLKEIL